MVLYSRTKHTEKERSVISFNDQLEMREGYTQEWEINLDQFRFVCSTQFCSQEMGLEWISFLCMGKPEKAG